MSRLLLDTCAAIWISNAETIAEKAKSDVAMAASEGSVFVSPMTAWEIGMLVSKNRLALSMTPEVWFRNLLELQGVNLAPLTPSILIGSAFLPGGPPSDPSDRIIAATARLEDLILVTRDAKLLRYAEQGHLRALAC